MLDAVDMAFGEDASSTPFSVLFCRFRFVRLLLLCFWLPFFRDLAMIRTVRDKYIQGDDDAGGL